MVVLVIVVVVAAVYSSACCVAGFAPAGSLAGFRSHDSSTVRRFFQPADVVMAAFRDGIRRTPGARLVEEHDHQMLVDLRPTVRVLDGNFGMVFRVTFESDGTQTVVRMEAKNKVPWSWSHHDAAFRHTETALRMNAKRHGIEEVV